MYERILVPLDGSKVGEAALPYVEKLVSKLSPEVKAEVTLLQIVSETHYVVVSGEVATEAPYTEKEIKQIKKKVTEYLDKVGEGLKSRGTIVKYKVVIGKAAEEIIKIAGEINADLVAMSTHGRSGLSRWAFGSITDRVLRGGNTPVLVVRAPREA